LGFNPAGRARLMPRQCRARPAPQFSPQAPSRIVASAWDRLLPSNKLHFPALRRLFHSPASRRLLCPALQVLNSAEWGWPLSNRRRFFETVPSASWQGAVAEGQGSGPFLGIPHSPPGPGPGTGQRRRPFGCCDPRRNRPSSQGPRSRGPEFPSQFLRPSTARIRSRRRCAAARGTRRRRARASNQAAESGCC